MGVFTAWCDSPKAFTVKGQVSDIAVQLEELRGLAVEKGFTAHNFELQQLVWSFWCQSIGVCSRSLCKELLAEPAETTAGTRTLSRTTSIVFSYKEASCEQYRLRPEYGYSISPH